METSENLRIKELEKRLKELSKEYARVESEFDKITRERKKIQKEIRVVIDERDSLAQGQLLFKFSASPCSRRRRSEAVA